MQVICEDEYAPSCARLVLGDPIYKKSGRSELIRIRAVAPPSPIGILILLGIFYLLVRK